jgi:excisionase family DNA binding protein
MKRKRQYPRRANEKPRAAAGLLTIHQVEENWRVSERTIRRMIADGRLRVVRVDRSVRITSETSAS